MPAPAEYSRTQVLLHWAVAALVAIQFLAADLIDEAFDARVEEGASGLPGGAAVHIAVGIAILALMLWRLLIRLDRGAPPPPEREPGWAKPLARAAHLGFYAVLIALPFGGAAAWALGSESFADMHEAGTKILIALIFAHVGAVIVHEAVWGTNLLKRMTRTGR